MFFMVLGDSKNSRASKKDWVAEKELVERRAGQPHAGMNIDCATWCQTFGWFCERCWRLGCAGIRPLWSTERDARLGQGFLPLNSYTLKGSGNGEKFSSFFPWLRGRDEVHVGTGTLEPIKNEGSAGS